jgi:hypothetical protein
MSTEHVLPHGEPEDEDEDDNGRSEQQRTARGIC